MSAWSFLEAERVDEFVAALESDLADGRWDARYGHFRELDEFDGGLRLVVGTP